MLRARKFSSFCWPSEASFSLGSAMSMSSLSIGAAGMHRAAERFEASATRISRAGTGVGEVDMASEMVDIIQTKAQYKASAKIVTVASAMAKATIDILA